MRYRMSGRTGLPAGEIGYGACDISGAQWPGAPNEEPPAALRLAIDPGCNFIDTTRDGVGVKDLEPLSGKTLGIFERHAWDRNFYA